MYKLDIYFLNFLRMLREMQQYGLEVEWKSPFDAKTDHFLEWLDKHYQATYNVRQGFVTISFKQEAMATAFVLRYGHENNFSNNA